MRLRSFVPALAAGSLAFGLAAPVLAQAGHDHPGADYATDAEGRVFGDARPDLPPMPANAPMGDAARRMPPPPPMDAGREAMAQQREAWERDRADWLDECRYRMDDRGHHRRGRDRDRGLGGALIGAAAGGLAGNVIAGRGDRTAGTVIGAVAGAAVGTAIDRSDGAGNVDSRGYAGNGDTRRYAYERRGDYCEQYFDYYTRSQTMGYPGQAYGYGTMMVMVPVAMQQAQQPCTETVVTEEWVTVRDRRRHRTIVPHRVPDKRVRIVPDKRVPM